MDYNEHLIDVRQRLYKWMSDDQFECLKMLCDLFNGHNHIQGHVMPFGNGIQCHTEARGWATFDCNLLTRAVVIAHDRLIRFEVRPARDGKLQLIFNKRKSRDGVFHNSHPTIEAAVQRIREQTGGL